MLECLLAPLLETLRPHFDLSKTRLQALAVLLVGIANGCTVNLSHLASQFPGRRSAWVELPSSAALLPVRAAGQRHRRAAGRANAEPQAAEASRARPYQLETGSCDVNVLVLAIVTRRFRVTLMWTLLDHAGNSATDMRIALMERYLRLFGAASIEALLADREFIGAEWMEFLIENNIPFAIRLKENMLIHLADGSLRQFRTLLRKRRRGAWEGWLNGMEATPAKRLRIKARRIRGGELLIVATSLDDAGRGLNLYRRRWGIECVRPARSNTWRSGPHSPTQRPAKTRGLNIEDTHITDPDKLATLLVVIALAVTWAYRCATRVMGRKAISRKRHGRREKSWFRTGLDALRNWILHQPDKAINAWTETCPRRPPKVIT